MPARSARSAETASRTQLDRQSWIDAAIGVLAEDGVDGLRVETLAKRCKVTKGSFYWHFKDRRDLLNAVLETWKAGRIADIVKQTRAEPGNEVARIHHVIDVYSAARNRRGIRIELALRAWARRDAAASAVVAEVDAVRLDCAKKLFVASGLPEQEAAGRSMLLYAYVFGQSLMHYESFAENVRPLKAWIADRIAR